MTLDIMDGELWQWDTGREVEAAGCEQVHFAKSTAGTCYTVEVAGNKAKIPDELLQAAGRVRGENEGGRDTAEKARVEAEAKREQGWTDLKAEAEKSVGDAVERADAANKAATKAVADVKATEAKLYPVAVNVLKGTAKDTFIHVDDAFPSSLLGIEIEGATEQVTTAGKNLLDYFKLSKLSSSIYAVENENLKVLAIDGRAWDTVPTLMTLKAGTYCASGTYFEIRSASDNSDIFSGKGKFTLNKDTEVKVKVGTNSSSYPVVVKAQIEMNGTATAYEPYTGGKPSPSPDYPQEIKVVENPTIKILGRNLMSIGINEYGNSADNFYMSPQIDRLTFSFYAERDWWTGNPNGPRIFIHEYYPSNGMYSAQTVGVLEFSKEIGKRVKATIPFKSKLTDKYEGYICIRGYFGSVYKNCHDFMLSFGDANEAYSDYVSAESAITLPAEHPYLAKLPDGTADEIVVDVDGNVELVARVSKVIPKDNDRLDFGAATDTVVPYVSFPVVGIANRFGILCNSYQTSYLINESGYIYCPNGSDITIRDSRFTSKEKAIELLNGVVVYIAVDPTRYPLGKIELPKAQDSIVNVWTDAEVTPRTGIEYTRDVNIVVANLEAAIASITEG